VIPVRITVVAFVSGADLATSFYEHVVRG